MICDECGNDINDDSKFCRHCGSPSFSTALPAKKTAANNIATQGCWGCLALIVILGLGFGLFTVLSFNADNKTQPELIVSNSYKSQPSQQIATTSIPEVAPKPVKKSPYEEYQQKLAILEKSRPPEPDWDRRVVELTKLMSNQVGMNKVNDQISITLNDGEKITGRIIKLSKNTVTIKSSKTTMTYGADSIQPKSRQTLFADDYRLGCEQLAQKEMEDEKTRFLIDLAKHEKKIFAL